MERKRSPDAPRFAGRDLRPSLDGARRNSILAAGNSRRGSIRAAGAVLQNRRIWAGLAIGGVLAAVIAFVWNRGSHEGEANARVSVGSQPIEEPARNTDARAGPAEEPPAPQPGFPRYDDYFDRSYYATYSYASPAYAPADWSRRPPPAPPSAFSLPSVTDLLEPAKLLLNVPLAVSAAGALLDASSLTPGATLSVPAPSPPIGLLTNNTPFHLFVTSDPVSAASATAPEAAPSLASSAGGSISSEGMGTVTGTAGSVTGTAGSLLRK